MNFKEYIENTKSYLTCNCSDKLQTTYDYSDNDIDNNLPYFRICFKRGLSGYKALLFFYDYLNDKKNNMKHLKPLIKYTGNKYNEYEYIKNSLPNTIENYYEPFFGGGGIFFQLYNHNLISKEIYINDLSKDLIRFYKNLTNKKLKDNFYKLVECREKLGIITEIISEKWCDKIKNIILNEDYEVYTLFSDNEYNKLIEEINNIIIENNIEIYSDREFLLINYIKNNLWQKIAKFRIKKDNNKLIFDEELPLRIIETSLHESLYYMIREIYNKWYNDDCEEFTIEEQISQWFYIREFCFGGMFRYSKEGIFNVPYGGNDYNKKNFRKKIDYLFSEEVQELFNSNINIHNSDYKRFLRGKFSKDDFIFLDPPYDTTFSEYDMNEFTIRQHEELAETLTKIKCKWMLVVQKTPLMEKLYKKYKIKEYEKHYRYRARGQYNDKVQHLIITNY